MFTNQHITVLIICYLMSFSFATLTLCDENLIDARTELARILSKVLLNATNVTQALKSRNDVHSKKERPVEFVLHNYMRRRYYIDEAFRLYADGYDNGLCRWNEVM